MGRLLLQNETKAPKDLRKWMDKPHPELQGKQSTKSEKLQIPIITLEDIQRIEDAKKPQKKGAQKHRLTNKIVNRNEIGPKNFVILQNVFKCSKGKHKVVDIDAIAYFADVNGKALKRNFLAGYCEQCRRYFILESTYKEMRSYGIPLFRVLDEKNLEDIERSYRAGSMRLAQESILRQYGYTVSQQEDLSDASRHKILAVLIDNQVMTKNEIIEYLEFFVSQRKGNASYNYAISKWEEDELFVRRYKMKSGTTPVQVNSLIRV